MSKYKKQLNIKDKIYNFYDIKSATNDLGIDISIMPYSLRILFENSLRHCDFDKDIKSTLSPFTAWYNGEEIDQTIAYMPARILMQDFTGVPAIVDIAAMRDAVKKADIDPTVVNPVIPVDLVIDHSVQVESFGNNDAIKINVAKEIELNYERYKFLKWGQKNLKNFRVVPPGTGICHQVNLEYLAKTIWIDEDMSGAKNLYPDSLVGTDSHTTMINGLSVLGWGVGGIEAEIAMLGEPIFMNIPKIVGVKITGQLREGTTATDLVLTITEELRKHDLVGKFVEFFGEGVRKLSVSDRATISNMAPEYGATCGFFPIDDETLEYLKLTNRSEEHIEIVHKYSETQCIFYESDTDNNIRYDEIIEIDISNVKISISGPSRPQDRFDIADLTSNFKEFVVQKSDKIENLDKEYQVEGKNFNLQNGSIVIAAITSCTNTSNPSVMFGAAILAKKACEKGLSVKPWVKTSFAPGSKVVTQYLLNSNLLQYLEKLGFNIVGYGCTTCIGNSGPLDQSIQKTIEENNLIVASVLSGNRNFEGRIHNAVRANYLVSPLLAVVYALIGHVNIDLFKDPIGIDDNGSDIYLKDIWPSDEEIRNYVNNTLSSKLFSSQYSNLFEGNEEWNKIKDHQSDCYMWDEDNEYIKHPPYFDDSDKENNNNLKSIKDAKILCLFSDSITTDHISPAGAIALNTPAADYLISKGVKPRDFNSYGARRGNHEVMIRGTFGNVRLKNRLCAPHEGGMTVNKIQDNKIMNIYDTAMEYKKNNIDSVVVAGSAYGSGSSRDWAAKGTKLLGIKVVIAKSFERIHRTNLVGMGVLPMKFVNPDDYKIFEGNEEIDILELEKNINIKQKLNCIVKTQGKENIHIALELQIYTAQEIEYIKYGDVFNMSLAKKYTL